MTEFSKVEDMPLGARVKGICLDGHTDIVTPLEFPVTQVETDSDKGFIFIYKGFNNPLRVETSIARGTWVEWEKG